jgi:hypothetical protein
MNENAILREYDLVEGEETRLYEMAKAEQWNASTDIDWTIPIGWPSGIDREVARGYRRSTLSQFWYGEQAALAICGQLIPLVPDMSAKLYLSSQVIDEARHTEVFGRYLNLLGGPLAINPHLEKLLHTLLDAPTLEEKLVGMQVLAEGLALDSFHGLMDSTADPLLRSILRKVTQDESRHMGFGVLYLKRRIAEATPQRRAEVERALAGYAATIAESVLWRDPALPPPPERWDVKNANAAFGEFMLKNLTGRLRQIGLKLAA